MSRRNKRIRLLTEHRQKQLDAAVQQLHRTRTYAEELMSGLERAQQQHAAARQRRDDASQRGITARDWGELNHWLAATRHTQEQAAEALTRAQADVESAREAVMTARSAVKQIEALAEREHQRTQNEERREEQRTTDEHVVGTLSRAGGSL